MMELLAHRTDEDAALTDSPRTTRNFSVQLVALK
jgi:hypothetical protein